MSGGSKRGRFEWAAMTASLLALGLTVAGQQPSSTVDGLLAVTEVRMAPDGRAVVFVRGRQPASTAARSPQNLWRVPFAGGDPQPLSSENTEDSHPRWSADGRQLAFLSRRLADGRDARARLFVMPSDGGTTRAVTDEQTDVVSFEWLPDGKRIAYLGSDVRERRVRIVDLDSGAVQQTKSIAGVPTALCWSASRSVVIATVQGAAPSNTRVAALPVTGAARVLTTQSNILGDLACSPDGSMVAWLTRGRRTQSILLPVAGGPARAVSAAGNGSPASVSWAANGKLSLVFVMNQEMWVDVLDVRTLARITVLPPGIAGTITAASWSSDGSRFAVAGATVEHTAEVFVGSLPLATSGRSDAGGAPAPPVRRITFSN